MDDRVGCSLKADEVNIGEEVKLVGDEEWCMNEGTQAVEKAHPSSSGHEKTTGQPDSCYLEIKGPSGASANEESLVTSTLTGSWRIVSLVKWLAMKEDKSLKMGSRTSAPRSLTAPWETLNHTSGHATNVKTWDG